MRVWRLENRFIYLSLLPSAAKRGEQIHQRLEMQILDLHQLVLRAE
jgi:hypothetical protein